MNPKINISKEQQAKLLETLQKRFEENVARHEGLAWNRGGIPPCGST